MKELIFTKADGVGILRIDRAEKMNAMTREMWLGMRRLLEEARHDDDVKVLVLAGTGRAFCAGADVTSTMAARMNGEQPERTRQDILERVDFITTALCSITKPIIGAINGTVAGAGVSMALLCDIRIASDQVRFGAAWVKRGLIPDLGATWLLPRTIGMDRALELMFTGDMIDAGEALRIGLVTKVVPNEKVMSVSMDMARRLAQGPTIALDFVKRAAYRSRFNTLDEQLDFESWGQAICSSTEDHKEGVRSFLEKRPPVFRGR